MSTLGETMRLVQADCETDATALDHTPFTPRGVGEALGATLAMVKAVAHAVELLEADLRAVERVLHSRTDHLA